MDRKDLDRMAFAMAKTLDDGNRFSYMKRADSLDMTTIKTTDLMEEMVEMGIRVDYSFALWPDSWIGGMTLNFSPRSLHEYCRKRKIAYFKGTRLQWSYRFSDNPGWAQMLNPGVLREILGMHSQINVTPQRPVALCPMEELEDIQMTIDLAGM